MGVQHTEASRANGNRCTSTGPFWSLCILIFIPGVVSSTTGWLLCCSAAGAHCQPAASIRRLILCVHPACIVVVCMQLLHRHPSANDGDDHDDWSGLAKRGFAALVRHEELHDDVTSLFLAVVSAHNARHAAGG